MFRIGNREFDTEGHTYIMGILNVTPDSFYDGGRYADADAACFRAEQMIRDGADIIDIGGESTRPGYERVSEAEETDRVVPVIEKLRQNFDISISIDTYKYAVAKEALGAGAGMLNSIWGFRDDVRLAELAARTGSSVCLMHNRKEPVKDDGSFMRTVIDEIRADIDVASEYGIQKNKIMIDPGVGFGKTYEQNILVIKNIAELVRLGFPVLMAASNKSVIGLTLDTPVDEREEGTLAVSVYSAIQGCAFVRVHDVRKNALALKMYDALRI
ncbi:MAG: dihydropteroate synthase [Eubacterium sp.]|nr:dihydropteroate synthase [Eubacterium sp.]